MKGLPLIHCIILSVYQGNIGMFVSWQLNIIFFSYFRPFSIINFHMNRSRYNMQALRLISALAALLLALPKRRRCCRCCSCKWNSEHPFAFTADNCKQSRSLLFAKAVDDDCIIAVQHQTLLLFHGIYSLHLDVSLAISLAIDGYCLSNSFDESSSFYLSGEWCVFVCVFNLSIRDDFRTLF